MNIYVGNLPLDITEDELRQEFTPFGQVISVSVMNDKYIGSGEKVRQEAPGTTLLSLKRMAWNPVGN